VGDRIFVPGRVNALPLREGSEELLLLQNVRDAAHRFVLGRHRRASRTAAVVSEIMRLPGVGPATSRQLWEKFGSVEAIRAATPEDLCSIPGIGKNRATTLLNRLASLG
jgi:excinuclease ABC subunit C